MAGGGEREEGRAAVAGSSSDYVINEPDAHEVGGFGDFGGHMEIGRAG